MSFRVGKGSKLSGALSSGMMSLIDGAVRRETGVEIGQDCVGCALPIWK